MTKFVGHRGVNRPDGANEASWHEYVCGHCGRAVSGAVLASHGASLWLLCPGCVQGSVKNHAEVLPSVAFGPVIGGLPDDVGAAYGEARRCMSVNALTAAELICRKILMHVAVEKGATEGLAFAAYLSHLEAEGYVTPPMKEWVDLIRQHGNRATHEIAIPDQKQAESTVMFTAELLRLTYEMEHLATRYVQRDGE